jgi:hypothetical protein
VEDDRRSLQALLEDVIVYSSWREGGEGGSRCLLLDEKRSAKPSSRWRSLVLSKEGHRRRRWLGRKRLERQEEGEEKCLSYGES